MAEADRSSLTATPLRRVFGLLAPHWRDTALTFVLGAAVIWISTTIPLIMREIIDEALVDRRTAAIITGAGWLLALAVMRWAANMWRRLAGGGIGVKVEYELRTRLTAHLLALHAAWHDEVPAGQLLSRASCDIAAIRAFLSAQMFSLLGVLTGVAAAIRMWQLSPRLAAATLALSPPLVLAALRYSRQLHPIFAQVQNAAGALAAVVEETAAGVRVVKASGAEARQQARLEDESRAIMVGNLRAARLRAFYRPLLSLLPQLSVVAVVWYGGMLVIGGRLTLGTLVAFNSYLLLLAGPVTTLALFSGVTRQAAASAERIFEILDTRPAIADRPDAVPLGAGGGRVTFEQVSLGSRLTRVSLDIAAGERVAIVGGNGSGKSTLAALMPRLYEPDSGRVLIDGQDITGVTLESLRSAVTVVTAEPVLFPGTLRQNVALARPGATDADVRAALRAAAADDLGLPGDLDTVIGERGYTLSGGQRQRIALARALVASPRVLVLDDALSHVDVVTEARILAGLGDVTLLLMGGRAPALRLADRVVVLDCGRVVDAPVQEVAS